MDQDPMARHEVRDRPFAPNPFSSPNPPVSTTRMLAVCVLLLCGIYKLSSWLIDAPAKRGTGATIEATPDQTRARKASQQQPPEPAPGVTSPVSGANSVPDYLDADAPRMRMVSKCTAGGKTSYGDGPCAPGTQATLVATQPDRNVIDSVKPLKVMSPPAAQQEQADTIEPAVSAPSASGSGHAVDRTAVAANDAECSALNVDIARLDALARQPLSGQSHDVLREERKKHRDRQFALRCR